jgi:membrane protein DedA with SNARE-associated domain
VLHSVPLPRTVSTHLIARLRERPTDVQSFIANYGYLAIFVLMLAESACIPIPSELIMLFGGALAAGAVAGTHLNLEAVIAAGVAGNLAGSYLAYAVGRYGGQAALYKWGRRIYLREHDLDKATAWFTKYGPAAVGFGRCLPVIRTFISLPAGIAGMNAVRFGLYTLVGCIPWTAALGVAGYAVGSKWEQVANDFHGPTYIIAGLAALAVVIGLAVFVRNRRANRGDPAETAPAQAMSHRR